VRFMNPVPEGLTGWDEGHAIGRTLGEVFVTKYEPTGASAPDVIAACLASGGPREIDDNVILVGRDGNGRGVSGTASPVQDANGGTIGAVLVFKDFTSFQQAQRQLAHSANHDGLTGLPNRSALSRAIAEASRAAGLGKTTPALCFIDLDRFKPVNDTAGHAAGDELLKTVARVIRASLRAQVSRRDLAGMSSSSCSMTARLPMPSKSQARLSMLSVQSTSNRTASTIRSGPPSASLPSAPDLWTRLSPAPMQPATPLRPAAGACGLRWQVTPPWGN